MEALEETEESSSITEDTEDGGDKCRWVPRAAAKSYQVSCLCDLRVPCGDMPLTSAMPGVITQMLVQNASVSSVSSVVKS